MGSTECCRNGKPANMAVQLSLRERLQRLKQYKGNQDPKERLLQAVGNT